MPASRADPRARGRAEGEVRRGLQTNSYSSLGQDPQKLFQRIDKDRDGRVTFAEFARVVRTSKAESEVSHEMLRQIFDDMDVSGDGTLSQDEVSNFVWTLSEAAPAASAKKPPPARGGGRPKTAKQARPPEGAADGRDTEIRQLRSDAEAKEAQFEGEIEQVEDMLITEIKNTDRAKAESDRLSKKADELQAKCDELQSDLSEERLKTDEMARTASGAGMKGGAKGAANDPVHLRKQLATMEQMLKRATSDQKRLKKENKSFKAEHDRSEAIQEEAIHELQGAQSERDAAKREAQTARREVKEKLKEIRELKATAEMVHEDAEAEKVSDFPLRLLQFTLVSLHSHSSFTLVSPFFAPLLLHLYSISASFVRTTLPTRVTSRRSS